MCLIFVNKDVENKKEIIGDDKISYLRNLATIKEKWAAAFTPAVFIAGIHTISRAESVNS